MPGEECGVVAVYNTSEAAKLGYLGLYALQHRGQDAAGIVTSEGKMFHMHKAPGLVRDGDIIRLDATTGTLSAATFGQSTQTFGRGLGSGSFGSGLSPLYQIGGARSMQFSFKVQF